MQNSTHDVTIDGGVVTKRFAADHETRAEREWACLSVLAEHAPGLAPRPLRFEEEDGGLSDPAYELADHEAAQARMAAYRPLWTAFWLVMLLPGNGGWRRNPPGTTEAQAAHFLALVGEH